MGPPKSKPAPPSGRALMTQQQKKDADVAGIGAKAASKAAGAEAGGPKLDKDKIRADAAEARSIAQGGVPKSMKGKATGKEDLSFLDAMVDPKKKK
eukprot:CAMPEP_0173253536 /NCGR_PEP_ID=MMETSP1142-20121109/21381_1 /TAXON_ID=483371 /ORGANISM="non described non described, Strain CCMP2298" /LENGTH=95 /DNA_ID=CAMNT_0014186789 /DNA_START=17 /DNA_END=304 /DNA_ORIENTATION=-